MFTKNFPEIFEASFQMAFPHTLFSITPIQDVLNEGYNHHLIYPNISKKEKELIIQTNKSFFKEFSKLYNENILLKNKLAKALEEKKKLNQYIIKHEQEIIKAIKNNGEIIMDENNGEIIMDENNGKIIAEKRMELYRKRKRQRRKKSEVVCLYNCSFVNCNKSYPSKGSLNMHIKLKHKQDGFYKFRTNISNNDYL